MPRPGPFRQLSLNTSKRATDVYRTPILAVMHGRPEVRSAGCGPEQVRSRHDLRCFWLRFRPRSRFSGSRRQNRHPLERNPPKTPKNEPRRSAQGSESEDAARFRPRLVSAKPTEALNRTGSRPLRNRLPRYSVRASPRAWATNGRRVEQFAMKRQPIRHDRRHAGAQRRPVGS